MFTVNLKISLIVTMLNLTSMCYQIPINWCQWLLWKVSCHTVNQKYFKTAGIGRLIKLASMGLSAASLQNFHTIMLRYVIKIDDYI